MDELISSFRGALEALDRINAEQIFQQALERMSPINAVEKIVVPALEQIGKAWEQGDVALSQVYLSGRFCEELIDKALPTGDPERKHQPRLAIVVLNDYHMLGKGIVYSMLRASGFEVLDYGRLDVQELIARAITDKIQILLISVLMLPSALKVRDVTASLKAINPHIKIVVGGAPFLFDEQLWREIGADAMGQSASAAVGIVNNLMQEISKTS